MLTNFGPDLDSVLWLESFLKDQKIPMLIVSHDREFLDQVCNRIVEIEDGCTVSYSGNYSKFLELRQIRLDQWTESYERQMKRVSEEEAWLKSARGNPALATAYKVREAALTSFRNSDEWKSPPPRDRRFRFRFPAGSRSSAVLIEGKNISHGYGTGKTAVLFQNFSFELRRGQRVALVGPNGSGKSSLLRLILGTEEPRSGYVEQGGTSIQTSYYAQDQADTLNPDHSILDSVMEVAGSEVSMTEIRSLLGQFMFKNDDVSRKIKYLSGGEKARVALCRMLLIPANFLVLDEVWHPKYSFVSIFHLCALYSLPTIWILTPVKFLRTPYPHFLERYLLCRMTGTFSARWRQQYLKSRIRS